MEIPFRRIERIKPLRGRLARRNTCRFPPRRAFGSTLVTVLVLAGIGCKRAAPPAPPPPEVLVRAVTQRDVPIYAEWVGTTVGFENAQVMPRVQGYLLKQDYRDGTNVKAGQLLFEIDDRPYKAALDQALGDLA